MTTYCIDKVSKTLRKYNQLERKCWIRYSFEDREWYGGITEAEFLLKDRIYISEEDALIIMCVGRTNSFGELYD